MGLNPWTETLTKEWDFIVRMQDVETTQVSLDGQLGKKDVVREQDGIYSALRKGEMLPLATTWMDLESIVLSEVSQRKKSGDPVICLARGVPSRKQQLRRQVKLTGADNSTVLTRGKGSGG